MKQCGNYSCKTLFFSLQKGLNAIILAYGQTGSGKSLTINGLLNSPLDIGILPRLVGDLFKLSIENYTITLEMSLVELIDGFVNDLLENSANMSLNYKRFKIVDEFQTLKLLYSAEARKEFIKNENYFSNLHSSVTTFYITFRNTHLTNPEVFTSKVRRELFKLADLLKKFDFYFRFIWWTWRVWIQSGISRVLTRIPSRSEWGTVRRHSSNSF